MNHHTPAHPDSRFFRLVAAALVAAAAWYVPAAAQEADGQSPRFRSSTDLVTIQASVRNGRGRPMHGLTAEDFEVRDNGQLRPILSLRANRESPISLAVLVDMSGSMALPSKIAMARQAYATLVAELRTDDEVAVFSFDARLHERRPFTADREWLRTALSEFEPFGNTSLYDATADAARLLAARSAAHKAIVVLTDGTDTSSVLSAAEVSGLASAIAVPVYVVATVPSIDQRTIAGLAHRVPDARAADLRDLAAWTGGQLVVATSGVETVAMTAALVTELRQQYVLAIEAAGRGEWRRLDVRVKRPAAVVRARSGYYGG